MKAEAIREGDIVEIDYIAEFTKEHINYERGRGIPYKAGDTDENDN